MIFSHVLYQLSYLATSAAKRPRKSFDMLSARPAAVNHETAA
jgi:hypothetical protein